MVVYVFVQLEYFETVLNQYFSSGASESLKSLQGILLEKATESCSHGNQDDDKQQGGTISPDDLIVRYPTFYFISTVAY